MTSLFPQVESMAPQTPAQPGNSGNNPRQFIKVDKRVENPYKEKLPSVGDKIGPNRIEQLIGEGGMANVYKVWHEGLEVIRAVKILKKIQDKEARERFLTEAKILADIHHPNILEIYNIGYYEGQIPFIETEFVDGVSVKKLITQNTRFALPAAVAMAYFVCQALQYAHTKDYTLYGNIYRGLIHRDIKPDNILIAKSGIVKLMDFGIARPSEVSLHTVGAKIMGTLVYLSPEQLSGQELDHRSDIFSLGCVLYEMITGARAFPQKTLSDLVQAKSKGEYTPVEKTGVDVPVQLVRVVNKSMALERQNRYATAAEMGYDLYDVLKEISEHAPLDILTAFIANPASVKMTRQKKSGSLKVVVSLFSSVTLLLAALVVYLFLTR